VIKVISIFLARITKLIEEPIAIIKDKFKAMEFAYKKVIALRFKGQKN